MSDFWSLVRQVLTPGSAKLRGQLSALDAQQRRLVQCLRILEDPAIKSINSAAEAAADFETRE